MAMVDEAMIKGRLETALSPSKLEVEDIGGCGNSFEVLVVSDKFEGLAPLARQRLVYSALKQEPNLMDFIHALKFRKCVTSAQYAAASQQK